jgi:hypothetical protein
MIRGMGFPSLLIAMINTVMLFCLASFHRHAVLLKQHDGEKRPCPFCSHAPGDSWTAEGCSAARPSSLGRAPHDSDLVGRVARALGHTRPISLHPNNHPRGVLDSPLVSALESGSHSRGYVLNSRYFIHANRKKTPQMGINIQLYFYFSQSKKKLAVLGVNVFYLVFFTKIKNHV